jgi:aspartyl-tRNA(Asn)/glutamyl-tRNA(Gln) amidotransferase subunit A
MSDPTRLDLLTQARLVRDGSLTARALTEAHLQRIATHDGTLGSFLAIDAPAALAEASAIDDARREGKALGPLAGVPIAIKDQIVTRHLETTAGSKILRGWSPPYDATVVSRLRQAGAVVLGKTNLDEFAMGSATVSSAFHVTRNPWALDRVPGGSSGGSAAAVAAHFAPGALGTDTGGSVRQPASFCGIVGLKPTYGRISRYGAIAYASSLDQVGTFARTVADVAALHQAIAGHDVRDQTSLPAPVEPPDFARLDEPRPLEGLRVGLPAEYLPAQSEGVDPSVRTLVSRALSSLEALGATLVPISLPHTRYAVATYYLIATAEASSNLARYDGIRYGHRTPQPKDLAEMYAKSRAEGFGPEVKRRIMLGTFALSSGYYDAYYGQAQRARTLIARDFHQAFSHVDLIVGPTSPVPAWRLTDKLDDPLAMYLMDIFTIPASLAGMPGLSLPIGLTPESLPVGLQLIGPPLSEPRLLEVGAALERDFPPLSCPFGGTP